MPTIRAPILISAGTWDFIMDFITQHFHEKTWQFSTSFINISIVVIQVNPVFFEHHCILDDLQSSRIKSFQQFLVRSCQNELMRSNNFVVKVAGKKCSEVEALPKNYYGCEQILEILSRGPQA